MQSFVIPQYCLRALPYMKALEKRLFELCVSQPEISLSEVDKPVPLFNEENICVFSMADTSVPCCARRRACL